MNKTKDQQAQEYVLNRQTVRHNAKTEEAATMADFDKTRKVWDAYDMEQAFEDGYTAAEQSMSDGEATVIQGWVACDKGGMVRLHYTEPKRTDGGYWQGAFKSSYLPKGKFPSLTWSDEPIECKILIKPKNR